MRDNAKGGALTEVTFYILLALYTPRHGYAVMQFIEEKTAGRLSLGAGTLYGAELPPGKGVDRALGKRGRAKKGIYRHPAGAGNRGKGAGAAQGAGGHCGGHHRRCAR